MNKPENCSPSSQATQNIPNAYATSINTTKSINGLDSCCDLCENDDEEKNHQKFHSSEYID